MGCGVVNVLFILHTGTMEAKCKGVVTNEAMVLRFTRAWAP